MAKKGFIKTAKELMNPKTRTPTARKSYIDKEVAKATGTGKKANNKNDG